MAETELLFQRDSSLATMEAAVIESDPNARLVALDCTVFYPGGGGQPHDKGKLSRPADGQTWPVISAHKRDGVVWHELGGDDPLPAVGDRLQGELDWERRYRLMRTHTALHVL